ncbi:MAG: hypothetical protein A2X23_08020 [Chloroflexi bacterium GWC2_73_18]|nr:MAG: hypothetical protein A2X23_08020 [Chloroflexi bacterium GWC2_73_18]
MAHIFYEIADLLEIKGELVFKAVAYRRVADAIEHSPVEVARAYREGRPPKLEGAGEAIRKKLQELADTGHLVYHERLRGEVPPSLLELLAVPGVGPRTVKTLHEQLGIATLHELRVAAASGQLRTLRGMTAKTEENVLAGIAAIERRSTRLTRGRADAIVARLRAALMGTPGEGTRGLVRLDAAGSYRRCAPTVGDVDLLAATDDPAALAERFVSMPGVERVLAQGLHKCAVVLDDGPQIDLMMAPPDAYGTFLVHFTGSKDHNVHLRGLARDRGWSLSENGFLRLGDEGEPLAGEGAELRTLPDETAVYRFLDLPWIEPELREDRGEVEAAMAARGPDGRLPADPGRGLLPALVEAADLRGDLHAHSDWSDGVHGIEAMAEAARRRGYAYLVLTDHSAGLGIARGLTAERARVQRPVVAALNERFAREEDAGVAPPETPPEGFRLLHGVELEIRADGRLDLDDETLAWFDVVLASLHQARRQSPEQLTARVLAAIRSPHVDAIAHPSGRLIGERDPLPLDWEAVYAEAARTGTWLEINGSDHRLDLDDEHASRARELGCRLIVSSDAHRTDELAAVGWGVGIARRGWLTRDDIANTASLGVLRAALRDRGART